MANPNPIIHPNMDIANTPKPSAKTSVGKFYRNLSMFKREKVPKELLELYDFCKSLDTKKVNYILELTNLYKVIQKSMMPTLIDKMLHGEMLNKREIDALRLIKDTLVESHKLKYGDHKVIEKIVPVITLYLPRLDLPWKKPKNINNIPVVSDDTLSLRLYWKSFATQLANAIERMGVRVEVVEIPEHRDQDECEQGDQAEPLHDRLDPGGEVGETLRDPEPERERDRDDDRDVEQHFDRIEVDLAEDRRRVRVQAAPEGDVDRHDHDRKQVRDDGHRDREGDVSARAVGEYVGDVSGWATGDQDHPQGDRGADPEQERGGDRVSRLEHEGSAQAHDRGERDFGGVLRAIDAEP